MMFCLLEKGISRFLIFVFEGLRIRVEEILTVVGNF